MARERKRAHLHVFMSALQNAIETERKGWLVVCCLTDVEFVKTHDCPSKLSHASFKLVSIQRFHAFSGSASTPVEQLKWMHGLNISCKTHHGLDENWIVLEYVLVVSFAVPEVSHSFPRHESVDLIWKRWVGGLALLKTSALVLVIIRIFEPY